MMIWKLMSTEYIEPLQEPMEKMIALSIGI